MQKVWGWILNPMLWEHCYNVIGPYWFELPKPVHNPCNVRLTDLSSGQCPVLPVRFVYHISLSIPAVHYKLDGGLCINIP